ncbi:MAG: transglycosylase domain-containing protein [Mogibacterium sp.]|nr:transglycosylase domain-containing protein [Mogibacterium sp.]
MADSTNSEDLREVINRIEDAAEPVAPETESIDQDGSEPAVLDVENTEDTGKKMPENFGWADSGSNVDTEELDRMAKELNAAIERREQAKPVNKIKRAVRLGVTDRFRQIDESRKEKARQREELRRQKELDREEKRKQAEQLRLEEEAKREEERKLQEEARREEELTQQNNAANIPAEPVEEKSPEPKKKLKERKLLWKNLSRPKKFVSILCCLCLVLIAGIAVFLITTAASVGEINPKNIYSSIEQSSYLYDINGKQIDTLHYNEDRKIIPISDMPEDLKNAFIAIEDKTFYEHHGFNFRRMIGAVLHSFFSDDQISGTSTITQQLARNVYLADIKGVRSIRRKLTEMYIAWRIENTLSKDEILEAYLNTIYLGYGNYGVDAAARTYFSKEVKDLDLAECAALAALPQAPDSYALLVNDGDGRDRIPDENINWHGMPEPEPELDETDESDEYYNDYDSDEDDEEDSEVKHSAIYANDISKDRRDLVLALMKDQGMITLQQEARSKVDIVDILHPCFNDTGNVYTYFTDYVSQQVIKDLVAKYDMTEGEAQQMVYTGGLKINTTLDSEVQNAVYREFEDETNFPGTVDGSEVQASMVITEVGTGYITAMAGGRNTTGSKLFNRALNARQPGSSIKPLAVYGAALQKSYEYAERGELYPFIEYYGIDRQGIKRWGDYITAGSVVVDEPLTFNGERWPENVTRTFSGWNTFRSALQKSINTCAVKILLQVGTEYSIDMLHKFGLTTVIDDESKPVNDINPASLALGAMTYGVTPLEMSLAYAAFPNGGVRNTPVCYTKVYDRKGKTILVGTSERKTVMDPGVAWIMTDLLKSNVSKGIAGSAAIYGVDVGGKTGTTNDRYDVWFDGFTPGYAASLWIGTDLNVEMTSGSWTAARLWARIMKQIPDVRDGDYRPMPDNVIQQRGEYYTAGTEPYRRNTYGNNSYGNSYQSGSNTSGNNTDSTNTTSNNHAQ